LRRCNFCIVDLVARGDQAVQQTHGVANLTLICCAYIATHENEQHCTDDSVYCIYITVLGHMVQIVLTYLTQWLTSNSMNIERIWFTKQHRFDHPRCANGKYWSRIRCRHGKADQKRNCKLLTRLPKIARYVRLIFVGSMDMLQTPVFIFGRPRQDSQLAAPVVKSLSKTAVQLVVHMAARTGKDTCMHGQFTAALGYTWRSN